MKENYPQNWWAPLWIFVVPAIVIALAPEGVREGLVYRRDAIADGEIWRLVTGHWVHFGTTHLVLNLIALAGAGMWLESFRRGELGRFVAVSAPLVGGMLWILEPAMVRYGGLSGLACGVVTLAALTQLTWTKDRATRIWCAALLVVVGVKALTDLRGHSFSLTRFAEASGVRVSSWAHLGGAVIAIGFFLSRRSFNSVPVASVRADSAA